MEKNMASYDLSDMMVQTGLHDLSRRFSYKQNKGILKKAFENVYKASEHTMRFFKRKSMSAQRTLKTQSMVNFESTQSVFTFVLTFVVVGSLVWFMLLLYV